MYLWGFTDPDPLRNIGALSVNHSQTELFDLEKSPKDKTGSENERNSFDKIGTNSNRRWTDIQKYNHLVGNEID